MSRPKIEEHEEPLMKVQREDATWLGVVDIQRYAPVTMTIKKVARFKQGRFENGRTEDGQCVIFEETTKMMVLNAGNTKQLARISEMPSELVGKKIELHVEELDRPFNGSTHGIRIKPVAEK